MHLRSEDQCLAVPMIHERLIAHPVPRAERLARSGIPDDEREVAVDVGEAVVAPHLVGAQDQLGVGAGAQTRAAREQLDAQFLPVVDAAIHDEHEAAIVVEEGLGLFERLRRRAQHALAERDRACNKWLMPSGPR